MKAFAAAALALVLLPLQAAAAETGGATPAGVTTVLHLSEQAQRMVARDRLTAVLRVDGTDSDAARLQASINKRMAAAVARAKSVPGVTVSTSGYSVYQERPKQGPAQWHGSAGLTLQGHEAPALLELAGSLQQSGLVMSSLGYDLSPEAARTVEDALTTEAIARLRQRAEHVAQNLGLAVERIRDLRLGNAGTPVPRFFMMAAAAPAAAPAPPPVAEPGEAAVTVSVEADVELGPRH